MQLAALALLGSIALTTALPQPQQHVVVYETAAVKTITLTREAGSEPTPSAQPHKHQHYHQPQPQTQVEQVKDTAPKQQTEQKQQVNQPATTTPSPSPSPTPIPTLPPSVAPEQLYGGGGSSSGDSPPGDMAKALQSHNDYRSKHSAPALTWSSHVAQYAKDSNNNIGCRMDHTDAETRARLGVGENLASGTSGAYSFESFVKMWYDEISQYDFASGDFNENTGHFTQLVWKASTEIGCDYYAPSTCAMP